MSPWNNNIKKINGLWPDANWTQTESEFYRKQLEGLNQDWLDEVIEEVRSNYSSKKPELKWFLDVYKRVMDDRTFHQRIAKDRAKRMSDESINDIELEQMRNRLRELSMDEQIELAERMRIACGMNLNFEDPVENWSNTRVALATAALAAF